MNTTTDKTYRCYKVLLDQFTQLKQDPEGNLLLPETSIHMTTRRRHSVAVDEILRIAAETTPAEKYPLLYKLITVRCHLDRLDESKKPEDWTPETAKSEAEASPYAKLKTASLKEAEVKKKLTEDVDAAADEYEKLREKIAQYKELQDLLRSAIKCEEEWSAICNKISGHYQTIKTTLGSACSEESSKYGAIDLAVVKAIKEYVPNSKSSAISDLSPASEITPPKIKKALTYVCNFLKKKEGEADKLAKAQTLRSEYSAIIKLQKSKEKAGQSHAQLGTLQTEIAEKLAPLCQEKPDIFNIKEPNTLEELQGVEGKLKGELKLLLEQRNSIIASFHKTTVDAKKSAAWTAQYEHRELQKKVLQTLFEKGFILQKKDGDEQKFKLFLRSASMSRQGSLSFIAADLYAPVMKACTLGLHNSTTGWSKACGLLQSKYNAYTGLALSDADRIDALPCGAAPEGPKDDQKIFLNEKTVIVLPDSIVWKYDRIGNIPQSESEAEKKAQTPYLENDEAEAFRWLADFPHKGQYVALATPQEGKNDKLTLEPRAAKTPEPLKSPFDGEGLITPQAANLIREALAEASGEKVGAIGTSFQIRLPFCKGMLHTVDFKGAIQAFGQMEGAPKYADKDAVWVTDIYGFARNLLQAEIILTESMFKAATWLNVEANGGKENQEALKTQPGLGLRAAVEEQVRAPWGQLPEGFRYHDPMQMYFQRCAAYHHALYLCRSSSRAHRDPHDFLNYQVLSTLGFGYSGYRTILDPSLQGLALLQQETPAADARKYQALAHTQPPLEVGADGEILETAAPEERTGSDYFRQALRRDPQLLYSPMARKLLGQLLDKRRKDTMQGRIRIQGMTRYLSSDLMGFLNGLFVNAALTKDRLHHKTNPLSLLAPEGEAAATVRFAARGFVDPKVAHEIFAFYTKNLRPAELAVDTVDVPGLSEEQQKEYLSKPVGESERRLVSIFRNPHMSPNEQTLMFLQSSNRPAPASVEGEKPTSQQPPQETQDAPESSAEAAALTPQELRNKYLGRLDGICMLPSRCRTAARLNGADFDGDIVRVITNSQYVNSLYRSITDLWNKEKAQFLEKAQGLTSEDLELPDSRPPQLPLIQMEVKHKDVTTVDLSAEEAAVKERLEKDYNMFLTSMGNRIGMFSNQCIALSASSGDLLENQEKIRLYTTAVGCEIDAAKTNYTVDIDAPGVQTSKVPFLRFNGDVKRGKKNLTIYFYYEKTDRDALDSSSAAEGYALLQKTYGFLNILPWYADRALKEKAACLLAQITLEKERPQVEGNRLTPEQIAEVARQKKYAQGQTVQLHTQDGKPLEVPQDVVETCSTLMEAAAAHRKAAAKDLWFPSLLWTEDAAKADQLFAPANQEAAPTDLAYLQWVRLLFQVYNRVRKSKSTVSYRVDETIRRILFLNFPEAAPDQLTEKADLLKNTLKDRLPQKDADQEGQEDQKDADQEDKPPSEAPEAQAPETPKKDQDPLEAFCKAVMKYDLLLSGEAAYRAGLAQALDLLGPAPVAEKEKDFLDLCCAARQDGGYLLPYYGALAVQNEKNAPSVSEMDTVAEKAEDSLHALLTAPSLQKKAEQQAQLLNAFADLGTLFYETEEGDVRMPMDAVYGQERLRSLAQRITESFYPEKDKEAQKQMLFYAGLYLSDPWKKENKNTYDFGCFFWDLCGPYAVGHLPTNHRDQTSTQEEADQTQERSEEDRWKEIREEFEKAISQQKKEGEGQ